jgi:hypothetical protein
MGVWLLTPKCAYFLMCGYSGFSVATNVASEDILLETTGVNKVDVVAAV